MIDIINVKNYGIKYFNNHYWGYIDFIKEMKKVNNSIISSYTFVPSEYKSPYKIVDFKWSIGGFKGSKIHEREKSIFKGNLKAPVAFYILSEFLEKYIEKDEFKICYFNEFISTSSSIENDRKRCKVEVEWKNNYVCMDEQISYFITNKKANKYEFIDMITYTGQPGPPYISGFLTNYLPNKQIASSKEIEKIFQGISVVFAGVYDAEGVLFGETSKGNGNIIRTFDELNIPYKYRNYDL